MKRLLDGREVPYQVDMAAVDQITYGNFGTENDRHFWPELRTTTINPTQRPVLIIKKKGGEKIIVAGTLSVETYIGDAPDAPPDPPLMPCSICSRNIETESPYCEVSDCPYRGK